MTGHIAVLVNPSSGRGRGAAAAARAVERLEALTDEVRVFAGDSVDDTRRLAREAVAGAPRALVVVGGDGTLSSVLDAVVGSGVPIALVPAGTGNDLARALGLPFEASDAGSAAAELALHGTPRAIDVGEVESAAGVARFLTVAALGFDAHVSERTNRLKWPRGRVRYYLAILIEVARLRPMPFAVAFDGGPMRPMPGTLIAVGSTRSYGGGMPVCPDADPADGLLDVTHVAPLGRAKLVRLFPLLLRGRHGERHEVTTVRATHVEVDAPGLVVYADGERVGAGRARIRVVPGALTMLVPAAVGATDEPDEPDGSGPDAGPDRHGELAA
ncbi:diacylglycerol kinase (ATP) [Agromyces hippuratus]|uniref:Diacylglycerol kinase (ATP) n=1 Tax=Agromyces hippuratus TaxID=286438 RepID=A0A852WUY6_9MICO|nr:diacylglycerol kinase [Agromyces hippuratus]NYG21378.1 diacylglycerol kinase (ATP) [Agromyces hippuratus]